MAAKRIATKYGINDDVHLIEIDRPAIVVAIWVGDVGLMYKVAYWSDGSRKEEYVFERELRAKNA